MGAPRSGTTFFASSIASHPRVIGLPEMHFVYELMEQDYLNSNLSDDDKVNILTKDFYFCSFNLFSSKREIALFLQGKTVQEIILGIVNLYNKRNKNKDYSHWVEHSPHSHEYIELVKYYFPDAIFYHVVRDPRAVVASTYKEPWGFKDVVTGSNYWRNSIRDILLKSLIFEIKTYRYEDIVSDFFQIFSQISEQLGLEFSPDFYENSGVHAPNFFDEQQQFNSVKLDSSRNAKWPNELKVSEIAHINAVNGVLMKKFNYSSEHYPVAQITGMRKYIISLVGKLKQRYLHTKFKNTVRKKFCRLS